MAEASSCIYFGGFTVSIGVAEYKGCVDREEFLTHADVALGLAKEQKNSVVAYAEQQGLEAYAGAPAVAK